MDKRTLWVVLACMLALFGLQFVVNKLYPPIPKKPKPVTTNVTTASVGLSRALDQHVCPDTLRLTPHAKVWVELDGMFVVGEGGAELLHAVSVNRSLTQAARAVGWSYRHAWGYLRRAEMRLGAVLTQSIPGKGRARGTVLTPAGERLLAAVRDLQNRASGAIRRAPRFVASGSRAEG